MIIITIFKFYIKINLYLVYNYNWDMKKLSIGSIIAGGLVLLGYTSIYTVYPGERVIY